MTIAAFDGQKEKKFISKVEEGRPVDPWEFLTPTEIFKRLEEEVAELRKAIERGTYEDVQDKTLDVANFAWILWESMQSLKQKTEIKDN